MSKLASPLLARLAILVALVLFAASCGADDDEPAAQADVEPTAESNEPSTTDDADTDPDEDATEPEDDSQAASTVSTDDTDLSLKPPVSADLLGSVDELNTIDLVEGDGEVAVAGSIVSMHYVGVLASDGTEFDSSWDRGSTFDFQLGTGQVIPGWDAGIAGMQVGGRRVLQIPSAQAYGSQAVGDLIAADSDLLFIVDLVAIQPPPPTPAPAPEIPDSALGSFNELGIIDLVEGEGRAVQAGDIIEVQYVGVGAADGIEFDSTYSRGSDPLRLTAGKSPVIEGWNEGLLGMKAGGQRILQIPSAMAYDDGADLVFRIHLELVREAPFAHTLKFEGDAPTEVEHTTLVEGEGPGAEIGDEVSANITILVFSTSEIVQSTYEADTTTTVIIAPEDDAGLNNSMIGIKVGEIRQVVLPAPIAFPNGLPPDAGIEADDALVFVVEPLAINTP